MVHAKALDVTTPLKDSFSGVWKLLKFGKSWEFETLPKEEQKQKCYQNITFLIGLNYYNGVIELLFDG